MRMELFYKSTRNQLDKVTASQAILKGLSDDGGLYVPEQIPALDKSFASLSGMSYQDIAYEVMKLYFTDYTQEELKHCIRAAYDEKFDTDVIAPMAEVNATYYLELFHGATIAFKDMALSILPHLLTTAAFKNHTDQDIVILTATSGDTGKAALSGFAEVAGTKIIVFYPQDGVSPIQEKQMLTQKGDNTHVVGIRGNFDDAQAGVKQLFLDRELSELMKEKGYRFSSANSINIGRLVPQIVYYVYAYVQMLYNNIISDGESMNVVVPTGNFGNILAAYYAKQMGLPIAKLICASNENKVLYDFLETGIYDKNREFILTESPSMDILVSSNLERLIYHISGDNDARNKELMNALSQKGCYEIDAAMKKQICDFYGNYASGQETAETISTIYKETGYVLDPHTAVAACVASKYREVSGDKTKTLIAATASPFKFTRSVMKAIDVKYDSWEDFDLVDELSRLSGVAVPKAIEEIRQAPILHHTVCEKDQMKQVVLDFLGIQE